MVSKLSACKLAVAAIAVILVWSPLIRADLPKGSRIEVKILDGWDTVSVMRAEKSRVLVKFDDGRLEWIVADRLHAADAAELSKLAGSDPAAPAAPGAPTSPAPAPVAPPAPSADPAAGVPSAAAPPAAGEIKGIPSFLSNPRTITPAGPFTQFQIRKSTGPVKHATMPLAIKPPTEPLEFVDLTPPSGVDLGNLDKLLSSPDAPDIVVAVGGRRDDATPLLLINTAHAAASEIRSFGIPGHVVMAVAAGGNIVVSKPAAGDVPSLHIWVYQNQQYQLRMNYLFIEANQKKNPDSAMMLSPARMIMRSGSENYLLDLPTISQLGYLECGDMALHCSGKFLIGTKDWSGIVIRPSDLAITHTFPQIQPNFTVDPTATVAAYQDLGGAIDMVKLSDGAPVAQLIGSTRYGKLTILPGNDLLIDGTMYYQMKTSIPVWNYDVGSAKQLQLANGQMLYVGNINNQTFACATLLPDADAMEGLAHATNHFAIAPGAHVSVAGDLAPFGDTKQAQENIERLLTGAGDVLDPAATSYKLTISATAGPTGVFTARVFDHPGPPEIRNYPAPCTIIELTLTQGDTVIWHDRREYKAQGGLWTHPGQTIDDAIAEAGRITWKNIGQFHLPRYIIKGKPGAALTLGSSTLTRTGFSNRPAAGQR